MRADIGINSFAVYEDATEFYGMAEVTLPEVSQIAEEVKGAGISGAFNGAFTRSEERRVGKECRL